jgi:hypothetical protein
MMQHVMVKHIWRKRVLLVLLFIIAMMLLTATLRAHVWPF